MQSFRLFVLQLFGVLVLSTLGSASAYAQLASNVCSPNASYYGCMSIMSFSIGSTTWTNSGSYPNCGAAYTGTGTNSNFTFNGAAGQTVNWSCTAGNYYGYYYDGYLFIWVDWNNDGDFLRCWRAGCFVPLHLPKHLWLVYHTKLSNNGPKTCAGLVRVLVLH